MNRTGFPEPAGPTRVSEFAAEVRRLGRRLASACARRGIETTEVAGL